MDNAITYELIGWDGEAAADIRLMLSKDAKQEAWINTLQGTSPLDLSLVYGEHVPYSIVARQANEARGRFVVLVGAASPSLGLPVIPEGFTAADLRRQHRWMAAEAALVLHQADAAPVIDFCTSTLPMLASA